MSKNEEREKLLIHLFAKAVVEAYERHMKKEGNESEAQSMSKNS